MSVKRRVFVALNRTLAALPRAMRHTALALAARTPLVNRPPRFMAIEPTNSCNLRCPLCPVGAGTMKRRKGFMDVDAYKRLIDEVSSHVDRILMNFAGEPLLHPRIGELVSYAEDRGIAITLGTHGGIDKMEELVEAGVSEVLFSLDGTDARTYQHYRVGGDLDAARTNLRKLIGLRDRARHRRTKVVLQFVVMKHNSHQVAEIVELGRQVGVDLVSLQPVCVNDFFVEPRAELITRWVPNDSAYVLHPGELTTSSASRPPLCVWAMQSVVLFNGDVTVCCFDASGSVIVGNAFDSGGFSAVWHSNRYREARKRVLLQDFDICQQCDVGLVKPTRFAPDAAPGSPGR